jgi:pterin-4a-carbinolamine dehydratase
MFTADKYNDEKFLKKRVTDIDIKKINILSESYLYELNNKIGLELPKRATSGTIAVEFALKTFKDSQIFVYGIELNANENKHGRAHYFKQTNLSFDKWSNSIDKYHDIDMERKYLKKLIEQKKIFKL